MKRIGQVTGRRWETVLLAAMASVFCSVAASSGQGLTLRPRESSGGTNTVNPSDLPEDLQETRKAILADRQERQALIDRGRNEAEKYYEVARGLAKDHFHHLALCYFTLARGPEIVFITTEGLKSATLKKERQFMIDAGRWCKRLEAEFYRPEHLVERAEAALAAGRFGKAEAMLGDLTGSYAPPQAKAESLKKAALLIEQCEQAACEFVAQMRSERDSANADRFVELLAEAEKKYDAFRPFVGARYDYEVLLREPETRREIDEVKAAKELERAERLLSGKSRARVLSALETVAEKYPITDAGSKAAAKIEKLLSDTAFITDLQQEQADGILSLAKNFQRVGRKVEAAERYREILDRYPGTKAAREAAEALKQLDRTERIAE